MGAYEILIINRNQRQELVSEKHGLLKKLEKNPNWFWLMNTTGCLAWQLRKPPRLACACLWGQLAFATAEQFSRLWSMEQSKRLKNFIIPK